MSKQNSDRLGRRERKGKKRKYVDLSLSDVVKKPPSFSYPAVTWKCSFAAESMDSYAANADKYYKQIMMLSREGSLWNQYNYIPPRHYPTNFVCTFNIDLNKGPKHSIVKIDFRALTARVAETGFNPQNFAAAIWRCRCEATSAKYMLGLNPSPELTYLKPVKGTVLLFASGRMVCTGTESEVEGWIIAEYLARMLRDRSGMPKLDNVSMRDFTTQNVAASAYAGFFIALPELSKDWSMQPGISVNYEPTLFPGLIFRLFIPKLYEWNQHCISLPPNITANAKTAAEAAALKRKWDNRKLVFLVFRSGSVVITGAKMEEETAVGWAWFHKNILLKFRDKECTISKSSEYRHATAPLDCYTANVVENVAQFVDRLTQHAEMLRGIEGFDDVGDVAAIMGDLDENAPIDFYRRLGKYGV